jgi:tetratricopeptide (TPR) repeat protein
VALSRVGDISTPLGRYDDAENALKEAQAIMEAVVAKDTTNLDALATLSFQHSRLGNLDLTRKRAAAAIQALGKSEDMVIRLIQTAPTSAYWRRHLIEIGRLRSEALLMSGEVGAAKLALKLAQEARERAKVYEGSEDYWQPETARLDIQTGDVLVAEGKLTEARDAFGRAENILLKLTALDSTNAEWKKDLEKARQRVASMRTPTP